MRLVLSPVKIVDDALNGLVLTHSRTSVSLEKIEKGVDDHCLQVNGQGVFRPINRPTIPMISFLKKIE
jgi:hypothetical protein